MKYLVEDSSFFISLLDPTDPLHDDALTVFKYIYAATDIRIVVPTMVFHETLFTLIKNGVSLRSIKPKLLNFLMIDEIICHSLNEVHLLKLLDKFKTVVDNSSDGIIRTYDSTIVTIAMEYSNSCLITSDKGMKNRHSASYPNIFLFNNLEDIKKISTFLIDIPF